MSAGWWASWAMCPHCWRRWMAVYPVGTPALECPRCHRFVAAPREELVA